MDRHRQRGSRCPRCAARTRPGDAWCSLCHADLAVRPEEEPAAPALPRQRRGSADPRRPLVGGRVDADLVDELARSLALEAATGRPRPRWERPWLAAVVGTAVLLVVLLAGMAVAGRLL